MKKQIPFLVVIVIIIACTFILELVVLNFIKTDINLPTSQIKPLDNAKSCIEDNDCMIFGESGDCNCGCFNKEYDWEKQGACFCAAPSSCKCIEGKCEPVFEDISLSYEIKPCGTEVTEELNPYDESTLGIKEVNWKGNILEIKAYVSINCAEEVEKLDYIIDDNKINLLYSVPPCEVCAECRCVSELIYTFKGLDRKDYDIKLGK